MDFLFIKRHELVDLLLLVYRCYPENSLVRSRTQGR